VLAAAEEALAGLEPFDIEAIDKALRSLAESLELKPGKAFQPIRAAITGTNVSPSLFESIELLGREKTLERLRAARKLAGD
jgi:glutamyl-tRNA synthetase